MKSSNFQLIVLGIFVTLILVGAGIFATHQAGSGQGVGKVVIWGTVDQTAMEVALQTLRSSDKTFSNVSYVAHDPATYQSELVDAMASGKGPDLFFITPETAPSFLNKVQIIPYSAVSQQAFTTAYIDEGSLFLTSQGPLAMPLFIDPMVMYVNRDNLSAAGVAQAPATWDAVLSVAPQLTSASSDGSGTLAKSAVALGSWNNIPNAKEIYLTLAMQAGDPILGRDPSGNTELVFGETPQSASGQQAGQNPAVGALQFFTEFSNPNKVSYSWNRSLPQAQDAFVAGKLALYFGFASEYPTLLLRNSNIHIGVNPLPQIAGGDQRLTYGRMIGAAIARTSQNPNGALLVAEALGSQAGVTALATAAKLPPVRRDVTFDTSGNGPMATFVQSAIMSRAWLDPEPAKTDDIFKTMIESVVTGAAQPDSAVSQAVQALQLFYRNATGGAVQ